MELCMQTPLLSLLLNLVLSVGNIMLPIEELMVDDGCIATTGGRRLFCIFQLRFTPLKTYVLRGYICKYHFLIKKLYDHSSIKSSYMDFTDVVRHHTNLSSTFVKLTLANIRTKCIQLAYFFG
jgi:hypothetical protein